MNVILTSHLGGSYRENGKRIPAMLMEDNGLLEKLRSLWPDSARVLMICADPADYVKNDTVLSCFTQAFPMSGLDYASLEMCDDRNMESAADLSRKDVIILTGGHVPTQNRFFREISLKEKLNGYTGLVIAWSAGSMNCADPVYAGPELPGEAVDPAFQRWIPGLGLTKTNIFPHFNALKDDVLDGMRLIEDITFADSKAHEIIAINDGSYITIDQNGEMLYGEAYSIKNGVMKQICRNGESIKL
ncbi:MAG: Type 1 glutamine amidotransferase-like domain-containing protein [Clostridia bacterium]|nr:Type 1 glutamine amidotransferase-like domain-containing protein [Clostridia bacterium]